MLRLVSRFREVELLFMQNNLTVPFEAFEDLGALILNYKERLLREGFSGGSRGWKRYLSEPNSI